MTYEDEQDLCFAKLQGTESDLRLQWLLRSFNITLKRIDPAKPSEATKAMKRHLNKRIGK